MLGELIARLDRVGVAAGILDSLAPEVAEMVEHRSAMASMTTEEFVAGAVREFIDHADDDLWFQLLTIMRKSEDPGLVAIQTILQWAVTPQ